MLHTPSQPHSYSCTSSLSSCSSCRPTNSARALKGGTDKRIHSCVLRNSHLDVCVLTKSAKRCNGTCVWMLLTAVFNVQFPPDEPHHADCVTGRVGSGVYFMSFQFLETRAPESRVINCSLTRVSSGPGSESVCVCVCSCTQNPTERAAADDDGLCDDVIGVIT